LQCLEQQVHAQEDQQHIVGGGGEPAIACSFLGEPVQERTGEERPATGSQLDIKFLNGKRIYSLTFCFISSKISLVFKPTKPLSKDCTCASGPPGKRRGASSLTIWMDERPTRWSLKGERGEQGEREKSATFTTYPHESKRLVNEVNVLQGYFGSCAHHMPNRFVRKEAQKREINWEPEGRQVWGKVRVALVPLATGS
jgi:hypothetical protein